MYGVHVVARFALEINREQTDPTSQCYSLTYTTYWQKQCDYMNMRRFFFKLFILFYGSPTTEQIKTEIQ